MVRIVLVLYLLLAVCMPCFAQDRPIRDREKKAEGKKLRTVFIVKAKNEKEYVFIRLTPAQFRRAQATAAAKKFGMVRVALHPRQIKALRDALGEEAKDARWSKIIIRISCKRLNSLKGFKNRYVIRPKESFLHKDLLDREELVILGGLSECAKDAISEVSGHDIKEADNPIDENIEELIEDEKDEDED